MSYRHRINLTVPVETTTAFRSWGIVLAIGVIVFIMAIAFFIYARERPLPVIQHKSGSFPTTVMNATSVMIDFVSSAGSLKIGPHGKVSTILGLHERAVALVPLTNTTTISFRMTPTQPFDILYVTEDGFGTTSNTGVNVVFANTTIDDVYFVLVAHKGARRFPTTVRQRSRTSNNVVIVKQKWQVVNVTDSRKVLAEVVVSSIPSQLTFSASGSSYSLVVE